MIVHWLVTAVVLLITAYIVPGFRVKSFWSALIAALVIGFVSYFLRPILLFLTLPLNFLTLGLFTFVVDAVILKICAALLSGLEIRGWLAAILAAVVMALLNAVMHAF